MNGSIIVRCPACSSTDIVMTEDCIRNIGIVMCNRCGEAYAFSRDDLFRFGADHILKEWSGCYNSQKRLVC